MTIQTISSREFTRDIAAAKRATNDGPVFITHRGLICPRFNGQFKRLISC